MASNIATYPDSVGGGSGGWFAYLAEWDRDAQVRFWGRGSDPDSAREELAQAREAWREEAGERAEERNRAGWAWIEQGEGGGRL